MRKRKFKRKLAEGLRPLKARERAENAVWLEFVRRAAAGGTLSCDEYEQRRDKAWPSAKVVRMTFGSWDQVCDAAGVPVGKHVGRKATITFERCVDDYARFVLLCRREGVKATWKRYARWAALHNGVAPDTLRRQVGTYGAMHAVVEEVLGL